MLVNITCPITRSRYVLYPLIDMHDIESIVEVETILKLLTLCRLMIFLWKLHLRNNWINERYPRLNTESSGLPHGLFSILTRFDSLETLLYSPTEGEPYLWNTHRSPKKRTS